MIYFLSVVITFNGFVQVMYHKTFDNLAACEVERARIVEERKTSDPRIKLMANCLPDRGYYEPGKEI